MGSVNGHKTGRFKPRLYTIEFPDDHPEFAGLVAKVKGASVGTLMELLQVADLAMDVADKTGMSERHVKAVNTLVAEFGKLLHWWNVDEEVTEDGKDTLRPVPATEEGLRSQDFAMVMALFEAWMGRIARVAPPLPQGSPGGPSSGIEGSMPMEIPSGSLPSL